MRTKSKYTAFCKIIKELRTSKKVTQIELGKRLGVRQTVVSKFETGERRLDFVEVLYLCEALKVDIEKFANMVKKNLKI